MLRRLVRALARLALDADRQTDILARARLPVDELALEYSDALGVSWAAVEVGLLADREIQARLRALDDMPAERPASVSTRGWHWPGSRAPREWPLRT
ncbi:hypothetical protein [Spongiactinospora sp. TRM90649]|uniref:hypothetical protein n=1 Tax=Spongiactinospora sp. TRM90649 TaxID=3031114 RepID=UPI0023F97989|nr:hypothetical protein [Spongiactinospora sp. TRM90649]MDF5757576.1 hypothetical protein [Spongiactinospora sp. TRM90649]